ncbi:hypothetical protein BpHYR1_016856 [Brachionus plicatilis]|uniref:Uncharacterized protein n=1 Tax=Brachionus plicatilis TaxID=10195 RepID=A0A3M7PSI5_BRAPC|nr:hypothetical protein BpHYR1_016856 [Brachionus plicatilis]
MIANEFKRLIKDLRFDNNHWHFHLTSIFTIANSGEKACNFDSVGMDIPIQSNRKKEDQKKH